MGNITLHKILHNVWCDVVFIDREKPNDIKGYTNNKNIPLLHNNHILRN